MGYELHITRNVDGEEQQPQISREEWLAVIEEDDDLSLDEKNAGGDLVAADWKGERGALWWGGGEIVAKHPGGPLIVKMVQIARQLNAQVQGDDGEIYGQDGTPVELDQQAVPPPAPGLFARIAGWFAYRKKVRELQQQAPAFRVGQRVVDPWGNMGTVVDVDTTANSGLGRIRVKTDKGTVQVEAYVATVWKIDNG